MHDKCLWCIACIFSLFLLFYGIFLERKEKKSIFNNFKRQSVYFPMQLISENELFRPNIIQNYSNLTKIAAFPYNKYLFAMNGTIPHFEDCNILPTFSATKRKKYRKCLNLTQEQKHERRHVYLVFIFFCKHNKHN